MPKVMVGDRCELSTRKTARALYAEGHLVIVAQGDMPSPGYTSDIVGTPTSTGCPDFALMRCLRWGVWPEVKVPYLHKEVFAVGTRPDQVVVQHAKGKDQVKVEDAGEELAAFIKSLPSDTGFGHEVQATGYSRAMSFDEAFGDALSRLPPVSKAATAKTQRVAVVETGALLGDGFSHLYVRVRREKA